MGIVRAAHAEEAAQPPLRPLRGVRGSENPFWIEERARSKVSVLPEKLVDALTPRERAALLAYLEALKGK
jgi:hypothetical protein